MRLLAIDPGVNGAWALLADGQFAQANDLPKVGKELNIAQLAFDISCLLADKVLIENVHSMPKQGVASSFNFGKAVGAIQGIVTAFNIPLELVAPQTWKKHFKLVGPDKEQSRLRALQLVPRASGYLTRKKDHGRAEAILMALWYQEKYQP